MDPLCCVQKSCVATGQPTLSNPQEAVWKHLEEMHRMMERLQRIQLLQEQRITELEHQLESHRERRAEFPFFTRLPPELRCIIWELALPVQIFRPFRFLQPSFLEWTSVPPPVISRVNREARYVAHKNGALYCHEFMAPHEWAWFNGRKDILDLSGYRIAEDGLIPVQKGLLQGTTTVLLDVNHVDNKLIIGMFDTVSRLPNVRTIYLMAGNTFQVERQYWHPRAVASLFGDRPFAHVNIEDEVEIERLEQLLFEVTNGSNGNVMDKWHKDAVARLRTHIRPPTAVMEPWKRAKRLIMQGWMSYNTGASLLDTSKSCVEGEDGILKEAAVRDLNPQMPTIKLVQAFELTPVSKLAKWYKEHGRQIIEDVRG